MLGPVWHRAYEIRFRLRGQRNDHILTSSPRTPEETTMKRVHVLSAVLGLFLVAPAWAADNFGGTWETTYGTMVLTQEGTQVKGFYLMQGLRCTVEGQVDKGKLIFQYREPSA